MTKNKLFFLKWIAIALAALLIILGINKLYVNGYYYTDVYGEVEKFRNVPDHIRAANFGSSHGLASFRYSEEEEEYSFNFALSGEDLYHDFQTMKQFSDRMDEGCLVTIPVSYFSFCLATDAPSQKRYYTYLDKDYLIDFNVETWINVKYFPVLRSIEFLFKDLIGDQNLEIERFMEDGEETVIEEPASTEMSTGGTVPENNPVSRDPAREAELREHAKTRAESWRSGRMIIGKKYREENTRILVEMIRFCEEKGWRPVLVTTPVYEALRGEFSEEELEYYFYSCIQEAVEKTGVLYLDYSADERFIRETSYYNNSDHMSKTGGETFYAVYKDDLRQRGYEIPD